jgi:23S rRNA (guanosine2251-2'-O)-methyltransferase
MEDIDFIIGIHSIRAALKNPKRVDLSLYLTEEARQELKNEIKPTLDLKLVSGHKLQEEAKMYLKKLGFDYQRVPGGAFLISETLPEVDMNDFYELVAEGNKKILCLDQISDVHNGGAILRTASFYGVDAVVLPSKKSFRYTPGYFRISSGAHEYLKIVQVQNLSKTLRKLKELKSTIIGLSEHASENLDLNQIKTSDESIVLVLGQEETGISNAVMRNVDYQLSLKTQGDIKSLNVSVASAISLEKCFGI